MNKPWLHLALLLLLTPTAAAHPNHALRHWEQASADPDRIVLTWAGDPATSQAVTWRTSAEVAKGYAEIALAGPNSGFAATATRHEAATEKLERPANPQPVTHYHSVHFQQLKPNTKYLYRVGDGNNRWSEWIEFTTARRDREPFTFLYFGDAQNDVLSHWSRVIRAAYRQAPHASFSVHAGDLINTAHNDREWSEWFKAGGWIHSSVPAIPTPGNHEYGNINDKNRLSVIWRPQFTLPVERTLPPELAETVYYIDYQGTRIISLNSNRQMPAQAKWLDQVLSNNPNKWTVITFHHPVFSSGSGRDNKVSRQLIKPVVDKHKVDLLLQGHDHTYARGHTPVRMTKEPKGKQITTMYVNSVSGPKMYEFQKDGWNIYKPDGVILDRKAIQTQFFQVIDVAGDWIKYRAYTADGKLYDSFKIHKDSKGVKTLHPW